jgi:spore germination protein KB
VPRQVRISAGLYACLLVTFLHVAQVLYLPAAMIQKAGQEAWLAVPLSLAYSLALGWLGSWVCLRHPGLNVAQIARAVLGRWVGGLVSLIYAAYFTWLFSLVLRDILDFTVLVLLPGTPGRVIASLMAGVGLYAVWHGLEPIVRVGFQVAVALVIGVLIIPLLVARQFSPLQLEPFLYHGVGGVLAAALYATPWAGDALVVMSLVPHLKHLKTAYRWTLIGVAGAAAMLTTLLIVTVLVLGPDLPARLVFPIYDLVRMIAVGNVVERIEVLLVITWMSGMWLKQAVALYAASDAFTHTFGLKSLRGPAVGLAIAAVLLTGVWRGPLDLISFGLSPLHYIFFLPVQIGIPVVLLAASLISGALRRGGSARA